jgi:hypothetical protein
VAYTPRFGLTTFGSGVPGSFYDDASKYTLGDRALIDALLSALEGHDHAASATRVPDPSGAPQLLLQPDIDAGLTVGNWFYRLVYVDRWGLRTAGGDEASVTVSAGPAVPSTPPSLLPITGGTLGAGQYAYALSVYVTDPTMSSLLGPQTRGILSDTKHSFLITFPSLPSGATGWTVWRQGPVDTGLKAIADVMGATLTLLDTGLPADCNRTPPQETLTGGGYRVTATLPTSDIVPVEPIAVEAQISDGGTIAPGNYTYRLQPCFVDSVAGTTRYGAVTTVPVSVTALTSKVTLSVLWDAIIPINPAVPAQYDTHMKVFGRGPTSGLLMTVPIVQGITTITDTGSGSPSATVPYTPNWLAPRAGIASWELHRTQSSGNLGVFSLVERVAATETEFGGMLVSTTVDMGTTPLASTVPTRSSTFDPPPPVNMASVPLGSFAYLPTDSTSPIVGPNANAVVQQLEGLSRTTTVPYTMEAGTIANTGTARYYHTGPYRIKHVRISAGATTAGVQIDVKYNGTTSFLGGPQPVAGPGLITLVPSQTIHPAADFITVDLSSGTVPNSTSLLIHLDVEDCKL